jgi:hypothetical protein
VNRVSTRCIVRVYEIDGDDVNEQSVAVESHWNDGDRIVLVFGKGKGQKVTVIAGDLVSAIRRASGA